MKKMLIFLLPLCLLSCAKKPQPQPETPAASEEERLALERGLAKQRALSQFLESLPLAQKVSQLFIENLDGNERFRTYETLAQVSGKSDDEQIPLVAGGYLYFSYNIAPDVRAMFEFNASVKNFAAENALIPPFLSTDQEGGFVNRLRELNGPLPSAERVATMLTDTQAYQLYSLQARQMRLLGFDMNLAPIAEECTDDNRDFLSQRSFGDAAAVTAYGTACAGAYQDNGIAVVLKHFPGNTNTDPHSGLPEIRLTKAELEQSLVAFKTLIAENPAAVLMSHARTSAVDPGVPACLSKTWVTDILRGECGYDGLIFSDDIFMAALDGNGYPPEKAVLLALEAGIDCIMLSEKRFSGAARILYETALSDAAVLARVDESAARVIRYKLAAGLLAYEEGENGLRIVPVTVPENPALEADFAALRTQNQDFYMTYFAR